MKIIFEYVYKDTCYGYVGITNDRRVEEEIDGCAEITLPPCSKKASVRIEDGVARVRLANSREVCVGFEKTPFEYEESYECFGDVRYKELSGTVMLKRE